MKSSKFQSLSMYPKTLSLNQSHHFAASPSQKASQNSPIIQQMPGVTIIGVEVENNPSPFTSPFSLRVSFEVTRPLFRELEWRLIYVGSADDEDQDQYLSIVTMAPMQPGSREFVLGGKSPDASLIPPSELLKLTAIILSISYGGQEFYRLGYYICYNPPSTSPHQPPQLSKVQRHIVSDKPRITKFQIDWSEIESKMSVVDTSVEESQVLSGRWILSED